MEVSHEPVCVNTQERGIKAPGPGPEIREALGRYKLLFMVFFQNGLTPSLSKHMGDGKVKLGRGPYAIFIAILSMHAGFQHPRTKYMLAPGLRKLTFLCVFSCGFAKWSI